MVDQRSAQAAWEEQAPVYILFGVCRGTEVRAYVAEFPGGVRRSADLEMHEAQAVRGRLQRQANWRLH